MRDEFSALKVSPEVRECLRGIKEELEGAYRDALHVQRRALDNVRMYVRLREKRIGREATETLLRFCAEGGSTGSVLRASREQSKKGGARP